MTDAELAGAKTELEKYKRGAKTLGEVIEKQCRDVLDVTGLHHLINEDGDGHWDVVWMRLFEMRDELASLKESTIARERQRGDSWRDRAQAAESRAQSLEVELQATKPRRVTAVMDLQVLPAKSTILDCSGTPWVNDGDIAQPWASLCEDAQGGPIWSDSDEIALPATVLYEPQP